MLRHMSLTQDKVIQNIQTLVANACSNIAICCNITFWLGFLSDQTWSFTSQHYSA